jgi:tetratricopeptide (TPR) repeat protein
MSEPQPTNAFHERLEQLGAALDRAPKLSGDERVQLRDDIVALFRDLERAIAELQTLREGVRPLVDRYKAAFPRGEARTGSARFDHLGGSTYRERGWSALAGADYDRAVTELRKAVDLDPESASSLALLAWAHLRRGETDPARPLLQKVMKENPEHPIARTALGFLRLKERDFADAIENLAAVLRDGTDQTAMLYANLFMGMVYAERDMHRDAQGFFRHTLTLGPNLTEAYWELGNSHYRDGRHDLALAAWKAGGENRFNPWGDKCREAVERLESTRDSPAG